MAISDNRWNEATAGRVYPVTVEAEEPIVERSFLTLAEEVRDRLNLRFAWDRNRARTGTAKGTRFDERLVKPAAYKSLNATPASGPAVK